MSATVPTSHPFPVASGGLERANATRPLRGPQSQYTRQPYLGSPPAVAGATGFGGGAGAFILNNGSDADQSQGLVAVRVGVGAAGSGVITLAFPNPPLDGQYWFAAEWAVIAPQLVSGNDLALEWTATRTLVAGELVTLAYQWMISQ